MGVLERHGLWKPPYTISFTTSHVTFTKPCKITGEPYSVTITTTEYDAWKKQGNLIQDALPHLTKEQREFLISGVTPAEWDDLWSGDDPD